MNTRYSAAWLLLVPACGLFLLAMCSRATTAGQKAASARAELLQVATNLQELSRLTEEVDPHLAIARTQPLSNRLSAAAAQAGLPSSCISAVSPEAESIRKSESGARILTRRASVTLGSLTLPQLGKLLDTWRKAEVDWIVTAIDINPAAVPPPSAGGDLPLAITLTLESVGIADPGAAQ
jgi:hypothetical protein